MLMSKETQTDLVLLEVFKLIKDKAPCSKEESEEFEENPNVKATQTENFEENTSCIQNNLSQDKLKDPIKQAVSSNEHVKPQEYNLSNEHQSNDLNPQDDGNNHHKNLVHNMIQGVSYDKSIYKNNSKVQSFKDIRIDNLRRELEQREKTKETVKKVGKFIAKTALISGGILGGIAIALPLAGFTASGVAAGSIAAAFQSTLGGYVASGSAFAVCQSVGAAGLAASTQAAVVAGSAAVVTAQSAVSKILKEKDQRRLS